MAGVVLEQSERLVRLLRKHPSGATNEDLQAEFAIEFETLLPVMQSMLDEGRLEVLRKGATSLYHLRAEKDLADLNKLRGLDEFEVLVYQGVVENLASEHAARMVAMKAASDNANTLIDDLTLVYNKARQAAINRADREGRGGARPGS